MIPEILRIAISAALILAILWMLFDLFGQWLIFYKPHLNPSRLYGSVDVVIRTLGQDSLNRTFLQSALRFPSASLMSLGVLLPRARAQFAKYRDRPSDLHFSSSLALRPTTVWVSCAGLGAAMICGLLTANPELVWTPLLVGLTWYVLVAVVLKHLSFVLRPLATTLRRSLRPPFVIFVAIAIIDALVLAILISSLRAQRGESAISLQMVTDSGLALFSLPSNVSQFATLTTAEKAVAAVGLLYSLGLARSALQYKEFARTDEDYQVLSELLINVGDFDQARAQLQKVKEVSSRVYLARARISMAAGRFEEAHKAVSRYSDLRGEDDSETTLAVVIASLALITPIGTKRESL